MLDWLPKLHKRPYKALSIANSSSCTTTILSKLVTSCLTAIKKHWIRYYDTVYKRDGINYFWPIKNSNEVLKFKSNKNFKASKLSTYDFSTLYTMLPHLIAGLGGSVGCASDWRPGGRGFDPRRGQQHSFVEIDHEIFSTVILFLLLIQEGQLSVSGERMCTILINRLEDKACPVNV